MASIKFSPLPGTLIEARRLASTLGDARVLTGSDATEGALKAMHAPRLLHLATHGFFLADLPAPPLNESQRGISHIESLGELPRPRVALPENPLLRSGLALAGANRRASGQDDGILTAMETMSLDLAGTQLVVLSACETGMGDVRTGDGVYGLRRALVLAGAETQIMTLWKIDDEVTQRLMAEYYEKIGKGIGRSDAMRDVTLKMLSNPKTANPKYWASFIVSGDPSPLHKVVPAASAPAGRYTTAGGTVHNTSFHAEELPENGMRYTTAGGTVYDTKTQLTWQQTVSSTLYPWADAQTYCAGVGTSLGGTGWRLPTIDELQTIVDKSRSNPSIDSTAFPSTPVNRFWSSSPVTGLPSRARLVDFYLGTTDTNDVSYMFNVRCVR
jgi:hypothetical protein